LRVSAAALTQGALWLSGQGESEPAQAYGAEAVAILRLLESYWRAEGYCGSRPPTPTGLSPKDLDISVILAAIHSGAAPSHGPGDPRLQATLDRLEALFDAAYAINRNRPAGRAPALGRYAHDVYYSGGAYYFATLGAAEFLFRAGQPARGDTYLETVRLFTPASGALSEQFDQSTGVQTSAKHLAWSYAAFITCIAARRAALA
jgi:glucoamylase